MKKVLPLIAGLCLLAVAFFAFRVFALNHEIDNAHRMDVESLERAESARARGDLDTADHELERIRTASLSTGETRSNRDLAGGIAGGCLLVGIGLFVVWSRGRRAAPPA